MVERITTFFLDPRYQTSRLRGAFIFYLLITVLGSIPHARATIGQLASGVVLHSLAYSLITILLFSGIRGNLFKKSAQTILIIALMGAMDECVQSFFSYRTASIGDWLVDCSASLITTFLLFMIWPVNTRST
ncbi:MAG: VanZ family protein [Burkholderiaceae bacterium]